MKILLIILITSSLSIAESTDSLKSLNYNILINDTLIKDNNNNTGKNYLNLSNTEKDSLKKIPKNDSEDYRSSISAGIGFTYLTKTQNKTKFLFTLDALLNFPPLTKYFFLGLGTDVFQELRGGTDTRITFFLIPQ